MTNTRKKVRFNLVPEGGFRRDGARGKTKGQGQGARINQGCQV